MPTTQDYRAKALEFLAMAQAEASPSVALEFQNLASAYLRLAELADRKRTDIVYEAPQAIAAAEPPSPSSDIINRPLQDG
jgi:hypothetical protein